MQSPYQPRIYLRPGAKYPSYPRSHVLTKSVGDLFTLQWAVRSDAAQERWVRLGVYETSPVNAFRGASAWTPIAAMSDLDLDASGPTSNAWTQGVALGALLTLEGAFTFADIGQGDIVVVASHAFTLTVSPGGGLELAPLGAPVIT